MKFKDKKTGTIYKVVTGSIIEEFKKNPKYEEIKIKKEESKPEENK